MKPHRVHWATWVARWLAIGIPLTGCIDATTVYTVPPDMPPPSGDDGAASDDGAAGDGSPEAGDDAGQTASDAPAPAPEGGAGD